MYHIDSEQFVQQITEDYPHSALRLAEVGEFLEIFRNLDINKNYPYCRVGRIVISIEAWHAKATITPWLDERLDIPIWFTMHLPPKKHGEDVIVAEYHSAGGVHKRVTVGDETDIDGCAIAVAEAYREYAKSAQPVQYSQHPKPELEARSKNMQFKEFIEQFKNAVTSRNDSLQITENDWYFLAKDRNTGGYFCIMQLHKNEELGEVLPVTDDSPLVCTVRTPGDGMDVFPCGGSNIDTVLTVAAQWADQQAAVPAS